MQNIIISVLHFAVYNSEYYTFPQSK